MESMPEPGAGILDHRSLRSLIACTLDHPEEWDSSRLGFVVIQKKSIIRGLLGESAVVSASNLVWIWRWDCGEQTRISCKSLAERLVAAAHRQGFWARSVLVEEGPVSGFSEYRELFPGGFHPAEAVLLGYPSEGGGFRKALKRTPELLMWIK
ncbi:MAG: hypothetical protein KGP28_11685 [Bdellovibrionales bacterium]|nr:hypothetical protein [Bdellovibrionales bacterium]